jgi:CheY-like chemotaxis protein
VKALVADDEQKVRDVLSRMLTDIGVSVITAENGEQALAAVRHDSPDIVFMDIKMPVMDGLKATQQILKEFGESARSHPENRDRPKLVAFSASALTHEQQRYLEAGFDYFIAKPVRIEEVCKCLASLLHVEYEYDDAETPSINIEDIVLPKELLQRIEAAAKVYGTTKLLHCFDEIEQHGEEGYRLAEHLRELNQKSDMKAILDIISKVGQS